MKEIRGPYSSLIRVLFAAYRQASQGKGKERHADDKPFDEQPMAKINQAVGIGFSLGQAIKKSEESIRLPYPRNVDELLGAIVYLCGAVIEIERRAKNHV